jgi:hypothetical protein
MTIIQIIRVTVHNDNHHTRVLRMYGLVCAHGYFIKRNYLLFEGDHRLTHIRIHVSARIREIDSTQVALKPRWPTTNSCRLSFSPYHALNVHGHLNFVLAPKVVTARELKSISPGLRRLETCRQMIVPSYHTLTFIHG